MVMKYFLVQTKYLSLLAVFPCIVAALAAYILGIVRTVNLIGDMLAASETATYMVAALIELTDIFLIATSLLIFGLSIYELFIGELDLPEWLVVHKFTELKDKLSSVVVLVIAVSFLKYLLDGQKPPQAMLALGIGSGSVIIGLGVYARLAEKPTYNGDKTGKE
jgi:uncharacterized membrane protein YqhA